MKKNFVVGFLALMSLGLSVSAFAAKELAKVNGKSLTDKDMKDALSSVPEGQRESLLKDAGSRRQVLQKLIDQEVLLQEAEKSKIDQEPEYKEALNQFRRQYLSTKILEKNLKSKLTDSEAKKFYEKNKLRYSTDQVHAQHILVDDAAKAEDLMKQAQSPGADFQALAEKYSKDPSAKNNRGDLGFFTRDRMVPEFTDAAFGGKAGTIVGPVKTSFGYHIIKVIERKNGKEMGYDEVEMRVKSDLQQDVVKSFITKLRAQAKVTIDDKAVEKM